VIEVKRNPVDIPERHAIIMCVDCKGLGRLGGSKLVWESCHPCGGVGSVLKDDDWDEEE